MKPGDMVKAKRSNTYGLFVGMRIFKSGDYTRDDYTCAEVMWFNKNAPNGDRISTIQADLLEVINESR